LFILAKEGKFFFFEMTQIVQLRLLYNI